MIGVTGPIKTVKELICPSQRNIVKHEKQSQRLEQLKLGLFPQNSTATDPVDVKLNMASNDLAGCMLQVWDNILSTSPLPLGSGAVNQKASQRL